MSCGPFEIPLREDQAVVVMAYVTAIDATPILQADFAVTGSIKFKVFKSDETAVGTEGSLVVADVVFDTPQNDDLWDGGPAPGYNFKAIIPADRFPEGDTEYVIEVKFTPTSPDLPFYARFSGTTEPLFYS